MRSTTTTDRSTSCLRNFTYHKNFSKVEIPKLEIPLTVTVNKQQTTHSTYLANTMASAQPEPDFDCCVIGAGPVGSFAANLLGLYGVRTLVLERDRGVYHSPRAVAMDDEVARQFGWISTQLADFIHRHNSRVPVECCVGPPTRTKLGLVGPMPPVYVDASGGFDDIMFFHQPLVDEALRTALTAHPTVTLREGTTVDSVRETSGGVEVFASPTGAAAAQPRSRFTARWVLAADGGSSGIRKQLGIPFEGNSFPDQPWLVVDMETQDPGLCAAWTNFNFMNIRPDSSSADSRIRSVVHVPIPGPRNGRRFEFLLFPDEDPDAMMADDRVAELLASLGVPSIAAFTIIRRVVYTFHARAAANWRCGRFMLIGDAAHCMPPLRGQGMCAGMRDAANAAWKVAAIVKCGASPRILDTYQPEREAHLRAVTAVAVTMGRIITFSSPLWLWHVRNYVISSLYHSPLTQHFFTAQFAPPTSLDSGLFDFHDGRGSSRRRGWASSGSSSSRSSSGGGGNFGSSSGGGDNVSGSTHSGSSREGTTTTAAAAAAAAQSLVSSLLSLFSLQGTASNGWGPRAWATRDAAQGRLFPNFNVGTPDTAAGTASHQSSRFDAVLTRLQTQLSTCGNISRDAIAAVEPGTSGIITGSSGGGTGSVRVRGRRSGSASRPISSSSGSGASSYNGICTAAVGQGAKFNFSCSAGPGFASPRSPLWAIVYSPHMLDPTLGDHPADVLQSAVYGSPAAGASQARFAGIQLLPAVGWEAKATRFHSVSGDETTHVSSTSGALGERGPSTRKAHTPLPQQHSMLKLGGPELQLRPRPLLNDVASDITGKYQLWFNTAQGDVAIIRPDRFVYGVYAMQELPAAVASLQERLRGEREMLCVRPWYWPSLIAGWALQLALVCWFCLCVQYAYPQLCSGAVLLWEQLQLPSK